MPQKTTCLAFIATKSTWKNYWEGNLRRDNGNIGVFNSNEFMVMGAIGISPKLNLIAALPYISNYSSQGTLKGQKGIQDISIWAKYRLLELGNNFNAHSVIGASSPLTNYVPDFLPFSIGLKSRNFSARLILNFKTNNGLYLNLSGAYIGRSKIRLDRDSYQINGKVIYSDIMAVPNATDVLFKLGYLKNGIQAEGFLDQFACNSGDNIRRNDMPSPSNNAAFRNIGLYFKYQPKNLGFNLRAARTIAGRNMGQSTILSGGLLYQINY
jgi:hypothetical protein